MNYLLKLTLVFAILSVKNGICSEEERSLTPYKPDFKVSSTSEGRQLQIDRLNASIDFNQLLAQECDDNARMCKRFGVANLLLIGWIGKKAFDSSKLPHESLRRVSVMCYGALGALASWIAYGNLKNIRGFEKTAKVLRANADEDKAKLQIINK